MFIREKIEVHAEHRATIFQKICANFGSIKSQLVIRVALWILGEYAESLSEVQQAFQTVKRNVGSLPIYLTAALDIDEAETKPETNQPKVITKTVVLPDGSYGTQTIVVDDSKPTLAN